jgi:hypothetical protein
MKSMRWGLTLSLMTDVYYQIILGGDHNTRWWYDEFDGGEGIRDRVNLGQPLGVPVSLAKGVYRRDQNALALDNSAPTAQTIQLGGAFKKLSGTQNPALNDGSYVTSVTNPCSRRNHPPRLTSLPAGDDLTAATLTAPCDRPANDFTRRSPRRRSQARSLRPRSPRRNHRRAHEIPHRRR